MSSRESSRESRTESNRNFASRADATITIELGRDERRIYDRLRASVVTHRSPADRSGVRDLLFLLPDLTVLLMRLMRDSRVPLASKALALVGVGYVLSPLDFMPAILLGPWRWSGSVTCSRPSTSCPPSCSAPSVWWTIS